MTKRKTKKRPKLLRANNGNECDRTQRQEIACNFRFIEAIVMMLMLIPMHKEVHFEMF